MRIPLSATPTMAVDGDFAIDTTVTDFSHGILKFFDGEEVGIVAMPIAQFTTPSNAFVVSYNATNDEFELVAAGAGDMLLGTAQTITAAKTMTARFLLGKGTDEASASELTLATNGNIFDITGTTTINTISPTDWTAGAIVSLQFDGILTVTHNSGGVNDILLGNQANMTTAAGDVLSLFFNGTDWVEVSRSVVGGGGAITFTHTEHCVMEIPEGTVAFPDVQTMATQVSKRSGFVLPDGASVSTINFSCRVPKDLAGTPAMKIRVQIMTLGVVAGPADVRLTVKTVGRGDAEDMDVAFTAETETTVTMPITTETLDVYTQNLTTNWTADEIVTGQLARDPADAADDFTDNIMIVGIDLLVDRTIS